MFANKCLHCLSKMDCKSIWVLLVSIIFLFAMANSEVEEEVKQALVQFMQKLSSGNDPRDQNWGWNTSTDPCNDKWVGVSCDVRLQSVRKIVLDGFNLSGTIDASSLCMTKSLVFLSLKDNGVTGIIPEEISNCKQLTHLFINENQFSGNIPISLSQLPNLKRLDVSNNNLSGGIPDFVQVSGLSTFLAENNQLAGKIPDFDFSNLTQFNVSNNRLSGLIPDVRGWFGADSFLGNPGLCGKPLSNACPPTSSSWNKSKGLS